MGAGSRADDDRCGDHAAHPPVPRVPLTEEPPPPRRSPAEAVKRALFNVACWFTPGVGDR